MIELENQSTRVASRRARCLTALDPRPRVLEFIVLEGLTSPLMLTTTLLGPSSIGIQSYVCTLRPVEGKGGSERAEKYLPKYPRRSRWRRWRFFFFFFFFGGTWLLARPLSTSSLRTTGAPEERVFTFIIPSQCRARPVSPLSSLSLHSYHSFSEEGSSPLVSRADQSADNDSRWKGMRVFNDFKNNIKKHCEKPDKKHKKKPISHRCSPMFSGSGRRTKERKEEEEEYICIYTYKKGRKRGKYHGDHLLLYIIPNVYVSTERIYPEARCLLRTMHVAVVMVSLHSPSR